MAFSKYVITNAGRDLLLGCMATGDFQIRSLVLGSGEYSGLMTEIEDVVAPVMTFSGESLTVVKRGSQLEIRAKLTNEALSSGFEWREYGVYATNGADTVLYCYDNAGNDPVPISSASGGTAISNTVKVILTIDNDAVANISFQPDPDIAAVLYTDQTLTESQKEQARANIDAATVFRATATIPTSGWESYQSSLYKTSVSVPGILASDTYGDFCLNQTGTETDDRQLRAAFANITRVSAAEDAIVVYAKKIPTVEISVGLEVLR